jgi:predicted permease
MRFLKGSPLVSIVAITSCALGIGASTAIFSIVDSLWLRPLPIAEPNRLAVVTEEPEGKVTYPIWEQIYQHASQFGGAAAWSTYRFDISASGQSQFVDGVFISGTVFDVLGVTPVLGRAISPADDRPEAPGVAMISYRLWQTRFAGDPHVIGATLPINRRSLTIVGVVPPAFFGLEIGTRFDVAVPYSIEPVVDASPSLLTAPTAWWVNVLIKSRPDQTLATNLGALRQLQSNIRTATMPPGYGGRDAERYLAEPFRLVPASRGIAGLGHRYALPVIVLMAVAVVVLLIACANVANLLLARTASRRHELCVRRALGASGLAVMLVSETLVLAGTGAVLGLACAVWFSPLLVQQLSTFNRVLFLDVSLDWRVLLFTVGLTVCCVLLFGTAPALSAARLQANDVLASHGRGLVGDRRKSPSQIIVLAQVAFSLVLVSTGGLFIRTFLILTRQPVGLERDRVLTVRVDGDFSTATPEVALDRFEQFRAAVADVPGVTNATVSAMTPVNGMLWQFLLDPSDFPFASESGRVVTANLIGPDYFVTLGTRLLAGREFNRSDGRLAAPVAIVNESFAKKYLKGRTVVGRHIRQAGIAGRPGRDRQIVGYVEDAVYRTLRETHEPTVYIPIAQRPQPPSYVNISARAVAGSPELLTTRVLRAISAVDPAARLSAWPLSEQIKSSIVQERAVAVLAGVFGAVALLLAVVGLYGVTAYSVTRRRGEIGLRLALGATPADIAQMVLGRVASNVAVGVGVGVVLNEWVSRFVAALLYGVSPTDPITVTAGAVMLVGTGAIAAWLPASGLADRSSSRLRRSLDQSLASRSRRPRLAAPSNDDSSAPLSRASIEAQHVLGELLIPQGR